MGQMLNIPAPWSIWEYVKHVICYLLWESDPRLNVGWPSSHVVFNPPRGFTTTDTAQGCLNFILISLNFLGQVTVCFCSFNCIPTKASNDVPGTGASFCTKNRVLAVFYLHPFTLIWLAHLYAAKNRTEHYKIRKKKHDKITKWAVGLEGNIGVPSWMIKPKYDGADLGRAPLELIINQQG